MPIISFPQGGFVFVLFLLRWLHFLAGITWIGFLYWFNLVNVNFQKGLDADLKPKVNPKLIVPTLFYFRWGAVVTVLSGFLYYVIILHPTNNFPQNFIAWFALVLVFYAVMYSLLQPVSGALNNGGALAVIFTTLSLVFVGLVLKLTAAPDMSNNAFSIGIGGGFGIWMMLNVWGIIWPAQKRLLGLVPVAEGVDKAKLARKAFLASRTNAWLSIPMLFFMAAASHFSMFSVPGATP